MSDVEHHLGRLMARLQRWYKDRCDGEWEHSYGIAIGTLDNPGWSMRIDLAETPWEDIEDCGCLNDRSEHNWTDYRIADRKFQGYCGIDNLPELLDAFFRVIDSERQGDRNRD